MKFLEERGRGFDVAIAKVPIVPAAVIFDLGVGNHRVRPDAEMGYKACMNARRGRVEEGSVGPEPEPPWGSFSASNGQ
jgi:L-aminopeptidase/D-esterase-like protein